MRNPIHFQISISAPRHASTETNSEALQQIAKQLRNIAKLLDKRAECDNSEGTEHSNNIREENGNKIGEWSIDLDAEKD